LRTKSSFSRRLFIAGLSPEKYRTGHFITLGGYKIQVVSSASGTTHVKIKMPRRFKSPNNFEVIVGQDASENHILSSRMKAHDLWFHARDCAGAHVVLRTLTKATRVPIQDIEWAAGVAAWFSKNKGVGRVHVTCAYGADVTCIAPKGTVTCATKNFISVKCQKV
jgi:predicted ribosome quality control (RQC) complex YloA/Tae2 family protein